MRSILILLLPMALGANAQEGAALDKLQARFAPEHIEDMRQHSHYKYVGLLLYYGRSFQVQDGPLFRDPTDAEILGLDLHAYDALRTQSADVLVEDPYINRRILLFSRDRFEALVIEHLSESDRQAYLAYRAAALAAGSKTPVP
ncbi:MAG: hypothetical protein IPK70_08640 [Flavobacteriales bacterium]|nr:hypothetical protein [Flavobacteriales bacterium]